LIEFRFDKKQLAEMRKKFSRYEGLPRRFIIDISNRAVNVMKKQTLSGQILKVRSGLLRNSIGYNIDESTMTSVVGSGARTGMARVKYADIHAKGGTIRPKKAKYLAIPLPSIMQKSRALLRGNPLGPRDFTNTFFYKTRTGTLILAQKKGRGIQNLFVMKKSVKIPRRDYVSATMDIMQREAGQVFAESLAKVEAGKS